MENHMFHHNRSYMNAVNTLEGMVGGQKEYVVNKDPNNTNPAERNARRINMTQSVIRTRNILDPNVTSYQFGILDNQPSSRPAGSNSNIANIEKRLTMQDVFFVYGIRYCVYVISTSGLNTSWRYQPMTFPNPVFYSNNVGINLDLMVQLWTAAELEVTVNKSILSTQWDLSQHLVIPRTQLNAINSNPVAGDNPQTYFNSQDLSKDALIAVEPNWILNGGNNSSFIVNYADPLNNIGLGTGYQLQIELYMTGFLAQNASSIMNNRSAVGS